jgi:hypothetical protein
MSSPKSMNEYQSIRIGLTIPVKLLEVVDSLAERRYATRSDILREALVEFIKKPGNMPPTSEAVLQVLAAQNLQTLRNYQKGKLTFKQFTEAGVTMEMQMELMKLGEL